MPGATGPALGPVAEKMSDDELNLAIAGCKSPGDLPDLSKVSTFAQLEEAGGDALREQATFVEQLTAWDYAVHQLVPLYIQRAVGVVIVDEFGNEQTRAAVGNAMQQMHSAYVVRIETRTGVPEDAGDPLAAYILAELPDDSRLAAMSHQEIMDGFWRAHVAAARDHPGAAYLHEGRAAVTYLVEERRMPKPHGF